MKRTRIPALVVAFALAAGVLAGCGGGSDLSDLPVKKLLTRAQQQIKDAKYFTIKGKMTEASSSLGIDLSFAGKDSHGTLTVNGSTLQIETIDDRSYFKPSNDFWDSQLGKSAKQVKKLIAGRWIVASSGSSQFGELGKFSDRGALAKQLLSPSTKVTKGESKVVDRVDCIALKSSSGTLYLDKTDARPVQLAGTGNKGSGTLDFTYDQVKIPAAPDKDDTIDLSKLTG